MERTLICFLLFACSAGIVKNIPLYPNRTVFKDIIQDIINFQKCEVVKTVNETLHAPTDVQDNCLLNAFSSFVNLTLLLEPVGSQQECMRHFLSHIKNVHRNMPHSAWVPKCSTCMAHKDQSLEEFLKNFLERVQRMYRLMGRLNMTCK